MLFRHSRVESSAHFLQAATVPLCIPWDDMATTHIAVLDTSFDALHLAPSQSLLPDVQPKLLRFDLPGILPSSNLPSLGTIRAPTAVVFVAPQTLTGPVIQPWSVDIEVSDHPGMPPAHQWREGWMSHGFIPPSIISAAPIEEVATERIVYNFRVHPHHAAFALWEVDFHSAQCPDDIYLLVTPDASPLPPSHAVPWSLLHGFEGRILNRAILSLARHAAGHWDRARARSAGAQERGLRIHFVAAETWDHAWLGCSFVDKDAYIDVDEEGLPEDAGMCERIMFWMEEAFESQYLQDTTAVELVMLWERTRFISMEEFRADIGDDEVFERILRP